MFRRFLLVVIGLVFAAVALSAQTVESGAGHFYERHLTKEREAIDLPFIRETDVVWESLIWRTIDVREKFNTFFYYPIERNGFDGDRKSVV